PVYTATWSVKKDGPSSGEPSAGRREVHTFYDRWSARHFAEENPGHTIDHKYIITDPRKGTEVVYEPGFTMLFPRMYSAQRNHVEAYKEWSGFTGTLARDQAGRPVLDRENKPIYKPSQWENLRYFMSYQVNWMYWRYFMWNFAGRQNDIQGHGDAMRGNWISGFSMIDDARLGDQSKAPFYTTQNPSNNKFFLLPLILGFIGLFFHFYRAPKDAFVVTLAFLFTGLAIIIYLNPRPFEPRERDYAYAGSFFFFAMWIGIGVYALYEAFKSFTIKEYKKIGVII